MLFLFKATNIFKIHICEYTKSHWIAYFKWVICMIYEPYHNKTALKNTHTHTHTHKNTGVNCHALLQGIFLTPEIKPSFPPSPALAGRLFITRSMYSLPLWMWMEREDDVGWHPGFWIGLWCICKKPELSNVHHVFDSFYRVSSIRSLQNVFLPF